LEAARHRVWNRAARVMVLVAKSARATQLRHDFQ
jgi:hypothetical protein